jgi:Zn-dependent protease with chaperone function
MKSFFARATPWHTIQTGDLMAVLSDHERDAVIAHERGHLVHWHAEKRLLWFITLRVRFDWEGFLAMCERQELEADRYAIRKGHGNGLRTFLLRHGNRRKALGYPCLSERLEALDG